MGLTNPGRALYNRFLSLASRPFPQAYFNWPPSCFARWTQSFSSDRCTCVVYQNHKSCSFRVRRGDLQGSVLGPVLFTLYQ